jgi:hypothetical protein
VVGVEVRDDDVAHVVWPEAESFYLVSGGFPVVEKRSDEVAGGTDAFRRVYTIMGAEPGIDQDEAVVGFDHQHVAHTIGAVGMFMVPQLR